MTNLYDPGPHSPRGEEPDPRVPLAWRMRPRDLSELIGQDHLLGPGKVLRSAIEAGRVSSLLLYGPPGCGKTGLAHLIAARTGSRFREINAVLSGIQEIRQILSEARRSAPREGGGTLVFVDEIHRFNKVQQSALLPDIERGTITLIGASTQNPSFAIIAALASRSQVYELKSLNEETMKTLLWRALRDPGRGLGRLRISATDEAIAHFVRHADGDARRALNGLEIAATSTAPDPSGLIRLDAETVREATGKKALGYDRDDHYDTISAFIKSMRGSDPDAALYWLAKMLYAGEDPLFIARRLIICASEDIGNADPAALPLAVAALQSVEAVGMPEARIPLAQAAVYLACAPKSNAAYRGIEEALEDVEQKSLHGVPVHLKDAGTSGSRRLGHGAGYLYPHDFPDRFVAQSYLPGGKRYYRPGREGSEGRMARRIEKLRSKSNNPKNSLPRPAPGDHPGGAVTAPGRTTSQKEEG